MVASQQFSPGARRQQAAVVEVDCLSEGAQRRRLEAGVNEPIGDAEIEKLAQAALPEKPWKHVSKSEMRRRRRISLLLTCFHGFSGSAACASFSISASPIGSLTPASRRRRCAPSLRQSTSTTAACCRRAPGENCWLATITTGPPHAAVDRDAGNHWN